MTTTTNVPAIQFTPAGLVLPAESDILAGVQADQDAAFGGGLNPSLETPQGQLAQSTTAVIGDKNSQIASIVNQVDPAFAAGRMQDAIGRIYFITRKPGTSTAVTVTCTGLVGVDIPVGAMAKATDNTIYLCTQQGKIPATGSIDLPFAAQTLGPIACPAGSVTTIYKSIPGWDSVTNAAPGVIGQNVESRADFEYRRQNSVALNAKNSLQSIYAAVFGLPNVLDVYATENNTSSPVTVGGVSLLPHSIYVAVVGGNAPDIAQAIWSKKSQGSDYNGNTTQTVVDNSGYNVPYPSYQVTFEIPVPTPILFAVQLANNPNLPSNIVTLVQDAIIAAFTGADGGTRARVGSTIYASRYYGGITAIDPNVSILSLLLGTVTANAPSVTMQIDQQPVVQASNISVTLV